LKESRPTLILVKVHEAVQKAIASPQVRDQLAAAGGVPLPGPAEQLDKLIKSDAVRYGKLIREAGIKLD
jgi:tripartite-type tricarboxylate transporter receptor subunit TctC